MEHLWGQLINPFVTVLLANLLVKLLNDLPILVLGKRLDLVENGESFRGFWLQYVELFLTDIGLLDQNRNLGSCSLFRLNILIEELVEIQRGKLFDGLTRPGETIIDNGIHVPVLPTCQCFGLTGVNFASFTY